MWIRARRQPPAPDAAAPAPDPLPRARRFRHGRRLVVLMLALAGAVAVVGVVGVVVPPADQRSVPPADQRSVPPAGRRSGDEPQTAALPAVPATTAAAPVTVTPTLTPSPPPAPVLRLTDPVPSTGPGSFTYATGRGELLGRAGTVRRYRVAVERNIDAYVAEFTAKVDAALADPRSWIGSGRLRLQRVPDGAGHDFTVYLVTAGTARRMCAASGVDIRVGGKPYTSCRGAGRVIINLDRWMRSVPHYVSGRVPLDRYRTYVVNHEVGHELGHGHERCPRRGRAAPVMMQQTLFLNGCVPNPWPYLSGERYAGPAL